MEVAGEELKTVSLEGTSRHSETSAPKYESNPPLAQIMGRNQATIVRPSAMHSEQNFLYRRSPKRVEKQRTPGTAVKTAARRPRCPAELPREE